MRKDERLIALYQQIYEHTKAECDRTCKLAPYRADRCCDEAYCEDTMAWAEQRWKIKLARTDHPTLPLMGSNGKCTAAPHLRPQCTVHQCQIAAFGFKDDEAWTKKYFQLRDAIERYEDPLEMERE